MQGASGARPPCVTGSVDVQGHPPSKVLHLKLFAISATISFRSCFSFQHRILSDFVPYRAFCCSGLGSLKILLFPPHSALRTMFQQGGSIGRFGASPRTGRIHIPSCMPKPSAWSWASPSTNWHITQGLLHAAQKATTGWNRPPHVVCLSPMTQTDPNFHDSSEWSSSPSAKIALWTFLPSPPRAAKSPSRLLRGRRLSHNSPHLLTYNFITYTILWVPYYNYGIMGLKTLF